MSCITFVLNACLRVDSLQNNFLGPICSQAGLWLTNIVLMGKSLVLIDGRLVAY